MLRSRTSKLVLCLLLLIAFVIPVGYAYADYPTAVSITTSNIDYVYETVTGVYSGMDYSFNNGTTWTQVNGDTIDISDKISKTATVAMKLRTNVNKLVDKTSISLPIRPAAPAVTISYDATGAVISGVTGLVYSTDSKAAVDAWVYTSDYTSGNTMTLPIPNSATTYYFRTPATSTAFASVPKTITVAKTPAAPSAVLNAKTEKVTGVTTKMEYTTDSGDSVVWTPISGTTLDVSGMIPAYSEESKTLRIRKMASTSTTAPAPYSVEKTITLPARAETPTTLEAVYDKEVITGVDSTMEYSTDKNGKIWTKVTGDSLSISKFFSTTASKTVSVRVKAVANTTSASSSVIFTLPQRANAPKATIDYTNEQILIDDATKASATSIVYSIDGGDNWCSVTDGAFSVSDYIYGSSDKTKYDPIMIKTLSPMVSKTQKITLPKRIAAPKTTSTKLDADNEIVTGVSTTMAYSTDAKKYTTISGKILNVALLYPTSGDSVSLYIRKIATKHAWASEAQLNTLAATALADRKIPVIIPD